MLTLRRVLFAAALVFVTVQMLRPVPDVSSSNDKFDHVFVFAALTVLGWFAAVRWRHLVPGLVVYAVATEVMQATLTSNRHGDPLDVLADVVGIVVIGVVAVSISRVNTGN